MDNWSQDVKIKLVCDLTLLPEPITLNIVCCGHFLSVVAGNIPGGMLTYEMVLATIMSVPENVWDEFTVPFPVSDMCYCDYWLLWCTVTHFTLSYSLYIIFRNQTRNKTFNYAFYSTTTVYLQCIYRVAILIIYVPQRMEFIASYLEITCV